MRDALRLLQEQGFAETIPYRGTYVTLLSLDNIKQMIYMRVAVETMVLRDFLEVQTPMVIEDIRHSIAQQRAIIREPVHRNQCTACSKIPWLAVQNR